MFGSGPSTSTPAIQLAEVLNEVRALIFDGMFYETSGALTLVATHHLDLDFMAIYRGYADGWSADEILELGESLVSYAQMVTEQVTAQWVMGAHRLSVSKDVHREDVIQPMEGVETGSEASIVLPSIELNIVLTESVMPSSSSTEPSVDATGVAIIEFRVEIASSCKR